MNSSVTPKEIAQILMSVNLLNEQIKGLDFKTDIKNAEDNEVKIQILLTIYNEMHQIWYDHPDISEADFLDTLYRSFESLGYRLHITDPETLIMSKDEIIHYANISHNGNMSISPYHPFYTAYLISESGVELPDAYKKLLNEPDVMPYIATYHSYSNGKMDIITFSDLNA